MSRYPFWKTQKNFETDDIHFVFDNCHGKWYYTEKPQGIRTIWTGEKFIDQNGKEITLPEKFISTFPKETSFDGHLHDNIFYVHDVPERDISFEERHRRMCFIAKKNKNKSIVFCEYTLTNNIKKEIPTIYNLNKNLILNEASSLYLGKRVKHTIFFKKNISH